MIEEKAVGEMSDYRSRRNKPSHGTTYVAHDASDSLPLPRQPTRTINAPWSRGDSFERHINSL